MTASGIDGLPNEAPSHPAAGSLDASSEHLRARLSALETRVHDAVARRASTDPRPDDPFRGLYLSDQQALDLVDGRSPAWGPQPDADLAGVGACEAAADEAAAAGADIRLRLLGDAFDLDLVDTELLLIALAPDLDPRFESLYGYLQDDVTRRRATIGLALRLALLGLADPDARRRLSTGSSLVGGGLLLLEDRDRPFLARTLRASDRATAFLLGDTAPDHELARVIDTSSVVDRQSASPALARALAAGARLTYLRELAGSAAATTAVSSIALVGSRSLAVDASRVGSTEGARALIGAALLEARLRFAVLVVGPIDPLLEHGTAAIGDLADSGWP
ncbi:MAG TPA: hypothetical protein VGO64_02900, partial [Candidatus Limnocylindrales bacterium]|nr:hypothetical protein [Candidatus Limnocylindrales bacterium]